MTVAPHDVRWQWVTRFSLFKNSLPIQRLRGHSTCTKYLPGGRNAGRGTMQKMKANEIPVAKKLRWAWRDKTETLDIMRFWPDYRHEDRTETPPPSREGSETSPSRCWRYRVKEMERKGMSGCGNHMSRATTEQLCLAESKHSALWDSLPRVAMEPKTTI